jgi:hypothetical protein
MKISKIPGLGRFGIFVDDVDLQNISHDEWMEIGKLHMQNLVTIIRNSNCDIDKQSELVNLFGEPRYGLKSFLMKKYSLGWSEIVSLGRSKSELLDLTDIKAINALFSTQELTSNRSNVSRVCGGYDEEGNPRGFFAEGELLWHSNESGTMTSTPGVCLLASKNVVGSATGFVTTPDYYESVSNSFRSELDEMIIIHSFTPGKINPGLNANQDAVMNLNMCPEDTEIPLVIKSPGGITGLHYSINTVSKIKSMTQEESDAVFKEINDNLFTNKYIYDHWYQNNGDMCLFDNSITLHRRLGNIEGRLCYRLQHDYTNLQDGVYQPYFQKEFQNRYNKEIREVIDLYQIKGFKLPRKHWYEYIPFMNNFA